MFGDANFAGCISTRKSTVGGVAMWSGQFVRAWSKTMGVLALSSGDSELAAFVRAATNRLGLQSILSDFDLCGHVAIKSDATAAIGRVHPLGLGKVRHQAVGDLRIQHHVRSGKFASPKCQGWRIRVMHKQSVSDQNHCSNIRQRVTGCLSTEKHNRPQKSDKKDYFADGGKM